MDPTGAAPKMDFKMLVAPAVLFLSRKMDFKDPAIVQYINTGFIGMSVLVLAAYYFIYQRINAKADKTKAIWVPPKPKPTLPFGLGPAPEPVKPEEYEKTTYLDLEVKQLKETVQQLIMGGAMAYFMAMKFNIHISLMINVINMPLNLYENALFKKYIMGVTKKEDGGLLYGEVFSEPTVESLAAAERIRANIAAAAASSTEEEKKETPVVEDAKLTPSVAKSAIAENEARVEELDEEPTKEELDEEPTKEE